MQDGISLGSHSLRPEVLPAQVRPQVEPGPEEVELTRVREVLAQPAPPVRIVELTPREAIKLGKQRHRQLKVELKRVRKEAFSGPAPQTAEGVVFRIERVARFAELQHEYQTHRATLNLAKRAVAGPVGSAGHRVKQKMSAIFAWFSKTSGMGRASNLDENIPVAGVMLVVDMADLIRASRTANKKIVNKRACRRLIAAAEKQLANPELPSDQRTQITEGVKLLRQRIAAQSSTQDVEMGVLAGASLVHTVASLVHGVSRMMHEAPLLLHGIPAATAGAGLATLPIGAALSLDSLWASYKNMQQAKSDQNIVLNWLEKEIEQARWTVVRFPEVVEEMSRMDPPADEELMKQVKTLAGHVNFAQAQITQIDRQLLKGDNTKEEVAQLKAERQEAQNAMENALKVAANLVKNQPGLEQIHATLVAKRVLSKSLDLLQRVVGPYIEQKLRTKIIGENVRSAAEFLALAATITAVVGLATTPAMGAGSPVVAASAVLGIMSAVTVYGGAALAQRIRRMQLGKDRVKTSEFQEACFEGMRDELRHWDAIKVAGMQDATMASFMFDIMRRHDPSIMPDWTAKEWAEALINDAPEGVHRKSFEEAMARMIYHDYTQGFIGSGVRKLTAAVRHLRRKRSPEAPPTAEAAAAA